MTIERLEQRALLSGSIELGGGGLLEVRGTEGADFVTVQLVERASGRRVIQVMVTSTENGQTTTLRKTFGHKEVEAIDVQAFGGDDNVIVADRGVTPLPGPGVTPRPGYGAFAADLLNINTRVNGGAGNDAITTGGGDDAVFGGAGDDSVDTGHGQDFLSGEAGRDLLAGGSGNDTLHGGDGRDTLLGMTGHDLLDGGDARDSVVGGSGRDVHNEGAYNGTPGEQVRVRGTLIYTEPSFAAPVWQIQAGGPSSRDRLDLDLNGFEADVEALRGRRVVATGHIEVREVLERGTRRVLVIDSIAAA
jgi:Ca2+-binding RTX toxin-like protein